VCLSGFGPQTSVDIEINQIVAAAYCGVEFGNSSQVSGHRSKLCLTDLNYDTGASNF